MPHSPQRDHAGLRQLPAARNRVLGLILLATRKVEHGSVDRDQAPVAPEHPVHRGRAHRTRVLVEQQLQGLIPEAPTGQGDRPVGRHCVPAPAAALCERILQQSRPTPAPISTTTPLPSLAKDCGAALAGRDLVRFRHGTWVPRTRKPDLAFLDLFLIHFLRNFVKVDYSKLI